MTTTHLLVGDAARRTPNEKRLRWRCQTICTRSRSERRKRRRAPPPRATQARAELEKEITAARATVETGETKVANRWADLQRSWDAHVAKVRERLDSRRAEHDVKRAQKRAEDAEEYASYAAAFAYSTVVEAEYAALDAALARMDAERTATVAL